MDWLVSVMDGVVDDVSDDIVGDAYKNSSTSWTCNPFILCTTIFVSSGVVEGL